jgi:hypothetical protein
VARRLAQRPVRKPSLRDAEPTAPS